MRKDRKELEIMATRAPGSALERGKLRCGDSDRFGYVIRYASGKKEFLGRTVAEALAELERQDEAYLAHQERDRLDVGHT